ncbi:28S ribosomal protein S18c, mitochondrial [Blomia tropicalis]|nr:28S ribosomal protein S18c, mitochondrial [Blomia tropicalis]
MIPISTQINFNLCFQNNTTKIFAIPNQRFCSSESSNSNTCSHTHDDLPDPTMDNPFLKEKRQCILCRYQITADYKNVRLLSQFISPFTGRMYDKHITGLCEKQHRAIRTEISRAIKFGLMSPFYRDPKYGEDPKLFDPTKPGRANPY